MLSGLLRTIGKKFIRGFLTNRNVQEKVIKDSTKKLLLSKSSIAKYRKNSLDSMYNPTKKDIDKAWARWQKMPGSNVLGSKEQLYNNAHKLRREGTKFLNSKEFPRWYKKSINKAIDDVPIKFRTRAHQDLAGGDLGVYFPDDHSITLLKRNYNKVLRTGVHEVKHAAQQRMMYGGKPIGVAGKTPSYLPGTHKVTEKLVNKNLVKKPLWMDKDHYDYLKSTDEVSARFEEIRHLRSKGGPFSELAVKRSGAFKELKEIFGSAKKVFDLEKQIWGVAPFGVGGLLGNLTEEK